MQVKQPELGATQRPELPRVIVQVTIVGGRATEARPLGLEGQPKEYGHDPRSISQLFRFRSVTTQSEPQENLAS